MKVTITFPQEIGQQVWQLPNRDAFVSDLVARALERRHSAARSPLASGSKWARVVRRIQEQSLLRGYSGRVKEHIKEFRDNFEFRNDGTP